MAHYDPPPQPGTVTPDEHAEALRPAVVAAIGTVYDPEIPVSIWELGLVYDIAIRNGRDVDVTMTLTNAALSGSPVHPGARRGGRSGSLGRG